MLDFQSLVLGPNMVVFGRPVVIAPAVSQPGAEAYDVVKAIFTSNPQNFLLADGTVVTDQTTWMGVRIVDLQPILPMINDRLMVEGGLPGYANDQQFWISDVRADGQGGLQLQLRKIDE
jgi:hypothetical protein